MGFLMKPDGTGFWPTWVAPASAGLVKEIEALKAKKAKAQARAKRRKATVKSARPA